MIREIMGIRSPVIPSGFTIATDDPEMMHTHLSDEFDLLERIRALDRDELVAANALGHEVAFLHRKV